jgi:hypothetical protein
MTKRNIYTVLGYIVLGLLVLGFAWYLFRPELLFVRTQVNEEFPEAASPVAATMDSPTSLLSGSFHGVAHETMGTASIYRLADGKRVLRFTGFSTSNGPDVQVYLGKAADANDNETVTKAGFFHLGALKGTEGDQNYELPDDLNVDEYHSVTIWCRRFGVNFATAPLSRSTT